MTSFYGSVNGGQGGGGEGIDTSTLMQKNNPTFNGTITGPNARFTGTVQIPEPTEDNHAATKGYVDAALADVDLSEVTTKIDAIETAQDELAAQLDDKVDAENPAFTGTATLNGKNIATVDQIPNISDLPYLDENNPTYTGTLAGADATFSGVVSVPTPTQDGQAVNKQYVDQAIAGVQPEVDLSEVQADIAELQTGKLDKANPTYTGSLTGENAAFSGTVTVATPAAEGEAANKGYVDAAKTELEGDINTLQQTVANQTETINTLNQQVTNITGGTAELPYLKNTGDSGTGVYNFTGATVNAADPVDNSNVATKHYVDQKIASAGGTGEVVSYTQGDGISISLENEISLSIDSAGANGLKVGANGLGLDLATDTTSGAMAASDKTAIASNTTEITNIKNGTTELPYLKETNPTYEGTLIGGDATFTGSVQVSTPDQDNEAANKSYVDATIAASNETIQQIQTDVDSIEDGTTELPYIKDTGDTVTGTYNFTGANVTIAEPTVSNNPATKNYVDTKIASAGGSGEVVSYTQGNGINISPENVISAVVDADNANGLAVDTSGIKLNVATPTTAGAMSGTDKAKLDATSTTEQMNQAIEEAVTDLTDGTTELPYVKKSGDTMHGSLTTTELFTDFVTIRNAGTDGKTGFQNNSDTDHIRVYDKVANTLVPIEVGEPVNNQDASTKKYVDDKVTTETAARTEAIESLDEAKADKDNPTFTGIISGANATLSGTLTGNTATFSGGITVPLEPGAEGSATSKKYVDDQIAAIDIEPLTQRVTTAEREIDTLQSDIINITNGTTELPYIPSDGGTISGPINWGGNPQEATELANKAYVDANDSDAVNSAKEYTNTQIEIAKGYTDEAVTNLTNGTAKLPYVTKEEVEIAADTRDVARAYRYTFNDGLDGTNSNAGFGFIDFTPAIVTEVDGSTSFSPLYIGEPKKDSQAATKKYVDDAIAAVDAPEYTLAKQGAAEDGYFATYYLTKDGAQVGEKINIPKDYLVKEAELLEVAVTDTPYSGAVIGDKYIDFTINTQASDEDEQHIYLPVKDLVDVYTGGNGININASNVVSVQIDAANANGLALGSAGLKLNLATTSAAGAMSAADKTKLDTAISEEQLTAVENEIDTLQTEVNNIKSGTTDLGYLKAANPTYTGTLNGVNATFTGDVIVPTPDGDTEAANKQYVDSAIDTTETALREDISEVQQSVMQQTGTIDILSQTITGITQGTMALPYIKNTGDTVEGDYTFNGKVNINQPTDNANATNKEYVDTKDTALDQKISNIVDGTTTLGYIKNTGGTATGAYDFTGATMKVASPSEDANAVNKGYVDEAINKFYHAQVLAATSKEQVDNLFVSWWKTKWVDGVTTYNSMLEDWFKNFLYDDRIHGVKLPLWETSHNQHGEFTDDSVGLTCEISTEDFAGQDDFAHLPQFWCVEVAVEKNADYTHTIYACEFIDDINVVRAGGPNDGKHLVWVLQKNTYRREYEEDGYKYLKTRCTPAEGYTTWLQGTDNAGRVYPYVGIPKYAAGLESDGTIGSRAGLKPAIFESYDSGIQKWRARGSQYTGGSYLTLKWQLDMIALKYALKGNSNGIEGCANFNVQTPVLIAESNANRVIINQNQSNNFKVGQYINIGFGSRLVSETNVLITNIETVNISETDYLALSFEGNPIETTTRQKVCTLAWPADIITNLIQGNDGQAVKGQTVTGLIQKTEFLNGAYLITSDEKWRWDAASDHEDGSRTFECYICEDASNITTGDSFENYTLAASINLPADYDATDKYITDIVTTDKQVVFPKAISNEASSSTGYCDGMWIFFADNAMQAPWHCGHLQNGPDAGLARLSSDLGSSSSHWHGGVSAPGLAK